MILQILMLNRDPRFYSAIFYNTALAKKNNTGVTMYTFENWNAGPTIGKDAANTKSDNTVQITHIKKFVYMGYKLPRCIISLSVTHCKFVIRWAHMVLTFAEAANHVTHNPNTALYGMTPKAAIKLSSRKKNIR